MRSSISPIEDDRSWVSSGSSVHLFLFLCEYWLATDHSALRSLSSTLDSYHESTFKNVFESELRPPYRSGPFSEDAVQYSVWNVMFWHPVDMSCSADSVLKRVTKVCDSEQFFICHLILPCDSKEIWGIWGICMWSSIQHQIVRYSNCRLHTLLWS